jgi:hypothetical protein
MALEPTSVQRDRMLAFGKSKLSLVQFLVAENPQAIKDYLFQSQGIVQAEKGTRCHQLKIDLTLTKGDMPYQYITVDNFPSSQALLMAHENSREVRLSTLREVYGFLIRPNPVIKKFAKGLGFMAPLLTNLLGSKTIKLDRDFGYEADPETDPVPEKVKGYSPENPDQPFFMMNLNRFSPQTKRGEDGKSAYNQYSLQILPYLISVGGYPDILGEVLGSFIGDQKDPLFIKWHSFALVFYPRWGSFLQLMTNTPLSAAEMRQAGLSKVVLMPSSIIQD